MRTARKSKTSEDQMAEGKAANVLTVALQFPSCNAMESPQIDFFCTIGTRNGRTEFNGALVAGGGRCKEV